jgi:hypothetical protein
MIFLSETSPKFSVRWYTGTAEFTGFRAHGTLCQHSKLGGQPPELAMLTDPYIREHLYTKIRFSTPAVACVHGGVRIVKNAGSI